MASKSGIYDYLLLVVRLCELDQEDFGREIVDVGYAQSNKGL
jgi:hypothetical protein